MYSVAEQLEIEKAIILVSSKFVHLDNLIKPTLLHCIRVGMKLYLNEYPIDIVIAAFLHDLIEDTDITETEIADRFNKKISELVVANSKNSHIEEKKWRNEEVIKRCLEKSEEAAIIKAADIIDNYHYYQSLNHEKGIEYCKNNLCYFKKYFVNSYKDKIFSELFSLS